MKIVSKISVVLVLLTILCAVVCAGENVNVKIYYGNARQSRNADTQWKKGITALEALRSVARVKTQQIGNYIFVTAIDDVKGKRREKAWYYEINGKHANKLANERILQKDDSMKWIYTQDVCSLKVDKE